MIRIVQCYEYLVVKFDFHNNLNFFCVISIIYFHIIYTNNVEEKLQSLQNTTPFEGLKGKTKGDWTIQKKKGKEEDALHRQERTMPIIFF